MNPPSQHGDSWLSPALQTLDAALTGDGPPVEFLPPEYPGSPPRWAPRPEAAISGVDGAVLVRTSGSTGTPKQTVLSAEALRASAEATATVIDGHGQWLLALQPSYVAGLAVLTRSLIAGTTPVPLLTDTTDPEIFTDAAERLTSQRRYASLVPTQLARLLKSGDHRTLEALRRFDAILLGGGATPPALRDRALHAGLSVIRTYGMSETGGGCVYDGRPLPGVEVTTDDDGRVLLSGPMVALGYLEDPGLTEARFDVDPGTGHRRFLTDDLGHVTPGPLLSITGRDDDVINTGGVKISAEQVRSVLLTQDGVREAFVAGAPDPEWGQRLCAAVVLAAQETAQETAQDPGQATLQRLCDAVREELGAAAVPKQLHVLASLPTLSSEKPDRQELLRIFAHTSERPPVT